jgi:hypothetical protein
MKTTATLAATAAVAIALAYPSAASADHKHFNVTVGGPGYAVSVGNAGFGVHAATPVILPAPVYGSVPAPVYAAPRVLYRPHRPYRVHFVPVQPPRWRMR